MRRIGLISDDVPKAETVKTEKPKTEPQAEAPKTKTTGSKKPVKK